MPPRFSSSDSMLFWNCPGSVIEEKFTCLKRRLSSELKHKDLALEFKFVPKDYVMSEEELNENWIERRDAATEEEKIKIMWAALG